MKRRVVITGIGVVTPLGSTLDSFWNGLSEGRSGVGLITAFDASKYPVKIAAEVKDWSISQLGPDAVEWENAPRQSAFAMGAGIAAMQDSGLDTNQYDPSELGVYLGCGEPFTSFEPFTRAIASAASDGQYDRDRFEIASLRLFDPDSQRHFDPGIPAISLAAQFNLQGPNQNCIAACVSSSQAIGQAVRMIGRGEANVMLCGGSHSCIHELGVTGFSRLSALSQRNDSPETAVRPFDRTRDGFVIGEGAAIFVAEELEQAISRRATIYGEITGYGSSQDAFRVTDTHPDGRGSVQAIGRALKEARLNPGDIGYINAHGTGTVLNDRVETTAIKSAFGDAAYSIPVSSTKSMLGHSTTACGAIELAASLLALKHKTLPPTINYNDPDPNCDLDVIPNEAREVDCDHVLVNNLGFGGQNAALVASRMNDTSGRSSGRIAA